MSGMYKMVLMQIQRLILGLQFRCVRSAQNNCIHTYNQNPTKKEPQEMVEKRIRNSNIFPIFLQLHHWTDANTAGKCSKCREAVHIFQGKHCRWCKHLVGFHLFVFINGDFLSYFDLKFFQLHDKCLHLMPKGQLILSQYLNE